MPADSDHAQVLLPAPFVYAGFLLLAFVLHLVLPLPAPVGQVPRILGGLGIVLGLVLSGLALWRMIHMHTPVSPHRPTTALVTDGPYRFTRNPIYLGFLLMFLGITFLAGSLWGFVLLPLIPITMNHLIINAEETYLDSRFQDHYRSYKSRVRRWL